MTDSYSYDCVAYPGHAFSYAHPDRLATIASLHGMKPAAVAACRTLELGCGTGGNIIPAAYQNPGSEFVGIDLSAHGIEQGRAVVAAVGLRNIDLRHGSIMDIDAGFGQFDYIIAHGVYSWVPEAVREKILAVFREHLAPHGVAFVSYNSHPGSHLRNMVRDMMIYHTRGIADPKEKLRQARAILSFLAEASAPDRLYGAVLRDQLERVRKLGDEVLFHDDLDAGSRAFLLSEVVEAAERHGLQYLAEASLARDGSRRYSGEIAGVLAQIAAIGPVARDQYQDFIEGHGFRRTLLCHREIALRDEFDLNSLGRYHLSSSIRPADGAIDLQAPGNVNFKGDGGGGLSTDRCFIKAALLVLGESWPAALAFNDLVQMAVDRLGESVQEDRAAEDISALAQLLFRACRSGLVEMHLHPPRLTTVINERPLASRLARHQAETGELITNLRHAHIVLEDEVARRFLRLVDGTRTIAELVRDLRADTANQAGRGMDEITPEIVDRNLRVLGRLGLLHA
jgi:SAM-dependent methyltransferase/methyltransferase-like protein